MIYWAHSAKKNGATSLDREGWQPLSQHLDAVADLAGRLATEDRPGDPSFARLAEVSGLLHDYGKYTDCFQKMLTTGRGRCQHAIHGAMVALLGPLVDAKRPLLLHAGLAVAGHHAGIPDDQGDGRAFRQRVKEERFRKEAASLNQRACEDCRRLGQILEPIGFEAEALAIGPRSGHDLYTRMLFSCLVDADRLDSASRAPEQRPLNAEVRLQVLLAHLAELRDVCPDGAVKTMRAKVLEDCLEAASAAVSLFSLSVPTGGGKTLAAMAFALRRAALRPEQFRRVIVVIPYLSIIEQNASVYARVFGAEALLEHHSGSFVKLTSARRQVDGGDEEFYKPEQSEGDEEEQFQTTGKRTATENWDSPLIVTTSVRFFETLFSNRPRDLRRVHNIARSIVILDEVQTLPRRLLGPLLDIMKELSEGWDVDFVFSTATQPAFERPTGKIDLRWSPGTLKEIVSNPVPLREALRRAEIRWETDVSMGWPEVASRVIDAAQCLAVVNLRDHAGELYAEVSRLAAEKGLDEQGIFHLSTRMAAAHRLRILERIRKRLKAGQRCHVISTQLVEAGVDLDFPLVLRSLAPLDSIVQAAGRADREGRLTAMLGRPGGVVVVFRPEDHRMPPNEYAEAAKVTESIVAQARLNGRSIQVDSAEAMREYFERYYGGVDEQAQGSELVELRKDRKFATLADNFEMISDRTREVFVVDDDEARTAITQLRGARQLTRDLRRTLQRHVVGLNPSEFQRARGVVEELLPGSEIWIAAEYAYDERLGLIFQPGVERLVL